MAIDAWEGHESRGGSVSKQSDPFEPTEKIIGSLGTRICRAVMRSGSIGQMSLPHLLNLHLGTS